MNWTGLVTNTHTEVARFNGGELVERVETRCGQRDSLLRERRETLCSLEADHDQAGPVVPSGVEGTSEANGCTRSLGGMEAPGALEVTRVPSVIVPVCVVKCVSATPCVDETPCARETPGMSESPCVSGVVTSEPENVLPGTPCVIGAPQAEETTCAREAARMCEQPCGSEARGVKETPRVSAPACVSGMVCVSEARESERPCVGRVTACVRSLCIREMSVGMHEHAARLPW